MKSSIMAKDKSEKKHFIELDKINKFRDQAKESIKTLIDTLQKQETKSSEFALGIVQKCLETENGCHSETGDTFPKEHAVEEIPTLVEKSFEPFTAKLDNLQPFNFVRYEPLRYSSEQGKEMDRNFGKSLYDLAKEGQTSDDALIVRKSSVWGKQTAIQIFGQESGNTRSFDEILKDPDLQDTSNKMSEILIKVWDSDRLTEDEWEWYNEQARDEDGRKLFRAHMNKKRTSGLKQLSNSGFDILRKMMWTFLDEV